MSVAAASVTAIDQIVSALERVTALLELDIAHMTDEMLGASPGGKARSGYDIVFEVVAVNREVAIRAAGSAITMEPPQGWMRAPERFRNKATAIAELRSSADEAARALLNCPPERLDQIVQTPLGELPLVRLAQILPQHAMYHSGQLNYIQTLHGDDAFHWG